MTATLVIRDMDDAVVERLRVLASAKTRTIEQQARAMIEDQLPRPEPFDRVAFSEAISAMTPEGIHQTDSVILLREDRVRDDDGE